HARAKRGHLAGVDACSCALVRAGYRSEARTVELRPRSRRIGADEPREKKELKQDAAAPSKQARPTDLQAKTAITVVAICGRNAEPRQALSMQDIAHAPSQAVAAAN